jgi:hypothetical protein
MTLYKIDKTKATEFNKNKGGERRWLLSLVSGEKSHICYVIKGPHQLSASSTHLEQ